MPLTHAHRHHAVDGRVETPVSCVKVSRGGGSMLLLLLHMCESLVDVAFIASYEIVELRAVDGSVTYSTPVGTGMPLRYRFDGPRCDITMNL